MINAALVKNATECRNTHARTLAANAVPECFAETIGPTPKKLGIGQANKSGAPPRATGTVRMAILWHVISAFAFYRSVVPCSEPITTHQRAVCWVLSYCVLLMMLVNMFI